MHDARFTRLADDLAALRHYLEGVDAVQPGTGNIDTIGVLIGQRGAITAGIPFLAVDDAGMAADADVEIDDEAEFFRRGQRRQAGHDAHSCP